MDSKESGAYGAGMDIHPALRGAAWARSLPVGGPPVDSETLAALVAELADRPDLWAHLVRHDPRVRWYERVALTGTVEVWLIGWCHGQHTPMHDHGGASGAVAVVGGVLQETTLWPSRPPASRLLPSGTLLEVPPAVLIERHVLEWRLDPTSPHCLPELLGPEQPILILCSEGYASSLAAATLRRLGLVNATDVAGGFRAWRRAGLPTAGGL